MNNWRLYAVVGASLTGLGAMVSALHSWNEALQPLFVGGAMAQLGSVVLAIFTEKPGGSHGGQ